MQHEHKHAHTYIWACVQANTWMNTCRITYACFLIHKCTCMHTKSQYRSHMYACIYVSHMCVAFLALCMCTNMCRDVCRLTCIHAPTHTYIQILIQTHSQMHIYKLTWIHTFMHRICTHIHGHAYSHVHIHRLTYTCKHLAQTHIFAAPYFLVYFWTKLVCLFLSTVDLAT